MASQAYGPGWTGVLRFRSGKGITRENQTNTVHSGPSRSETLCIGPLTISRAKQSPALLVLSLGIRIPSLEIHSQSIQSSQEVPK